MNQIFTHDLACLSWSLLLQVVPSIFLYMACSSPLRSEYFFTSLESSAWIVWGRKKKPQYNHLRGLRKFPFNYIDSVLIAFYFFLGFTEPRRWTFSKQYHQISQAWNQPQFYPSCDQFLISEKMQNPHSVLEPSCMCRKPITAIANAVDTLMSQSHHTISARATWVTSMRLSPSIKWYYETKHGSFGETSLHKSPRRGK